MTKLRGNPRAGDCGGGDRRAGDCGRRRRSVRPERAAPKAVRRCWRICACRPFSTRRAAARLDAYVAAAKSEASTKAREQAAAYAAVREAAAKAEERSPREGRSWHRRGGSDPNGHQPMSAALSTCCFRGAAGVFRREASAHAAVCGRPRRPLPRRTTRRLRRTTWRPTT